MIYVPSHVYEIEQTLVVKTRAPLSTIGPAIKQAVEALGPGRPVFNIRLMGDIVEASIDNTRFTMLVLSGFAVASLLLAGVGIYGVTAYGVAQRTHEIGIRLALGATGERVLREIVGRGVRLTLAAVAIGLTAAVLMGRLATAVLFGVKPTDPGALAGAAAVLALVSLAATYLPARRAARVDPVVALAEE